VSVLLYYFGWPDGAVWSNLLASLICAVFVWWRLRARMIAHHVEQIAQRDRHHEEMKAHVTASVPARAARQPKTLVTKPAKGAGA
jgi:hypothetical protein